MQIKGKFDNSAMHTQNVLIVHLKLLSIVGQILVLLNLV